MITRPTSVLVLGATGSIGRLVVEESVWQGYPTRALVRDPDKARWLPAEADIVVGDGTRPDTLLAAVAGIDAIGHCTLHSQSDDQRAMVTAGAVAARPVDASVEKGREESPPAAITTPRKSAKKRPPS